MPDGKGCLYALMDGVRYKHSWDRSMENADVFVPIVTLTGNGRCEIIGVVKSI